MTTPRIRARLVAALLFLLAAASLPILAQDPAPRVDREMVAKLRAEGLERSRLMDTVSYMTDVLGARLTLSNDMVRAQAWAESHMKSLGQIGRAHV